ncbi:2-hydroxymuconate tautomerase family protein [bacterium LRH843]|nr:2-hydroxymuconate tautomerase family protein [bacterium LRH843]
MPFITIKVLEGKTEEQKREMISQMTNMISETWGIPKEVIFIFFEDLKKGDYGKHGKLYSDL